MKVVRMTALALAVALGTNPLANAYAGDGGTSRGPQQAWQDGYDPIAAQSALAELILLGLALIDQPAPSPCSGCAARVERRAGVGHEK